MTVYNLLCQVHTAEADARNLPPPPSTYLPLACRNVIDRLLSRWLRRSLLETVADSVHIAAARRHSTISSRCRLRCEWMSRLDELSRYSEHVQFLHQRSKNFDKRPNRRQKENSAPESRSWQSSRQRVERRQSSPLLIVRKERQQCIARVCPTRLNEHR